MWPYHKRSACRETSRRPLNGRARAAEMEVKPVVGTFVDSIRSLQAQFHIPLCRFIVIHHRLSQSVRLSMVPVIVEHAIDEDLGELFEV